MGFFDFFSTDGPTQTQTNSADAFSQPYWQQYLSGLNNTLGNNPITPYGGPTVAPWNQSQNTAANMQYQFATNGTPTGNAANAAIQNQTQGAMNPYATQQNQYQGQTNAYAGDNPYLQNVINSSNADIAKAYELGANTYFVKPTDFESLIAMTASIHDYWLKGSKPGISRRPK
jgi:hypothetical protein